MRLEHNSVLKNIENAKERFWDVVLIDMLINNNDRNEDNWGVIKDKSNNSYRYRLSMIVVIVSTEKRAKIELKNFYQIKKNL